MKHLWNNFQKIPYFSELMFVGFTKKKWFPLGQKPCFLEPTTFEIPQSKSNFLLCLAMAMNSGLLCPRWLYLHSQCAASRRAPWAACRRLRRRRRSCLEPLSLQRRRLVWHQCGSQASSHGAARGVYGSQLFVLKATECQIQHPNVKVLTAFLFAWIFPFLLLFFIWLSGKGLHYVNFIGFLKAILGIWT